MPIPWDVLLSEQVYRSQLFILMRLVGRIHLHTPSWNFGTQTYLTNFNLPARLRWSFSLVQNTAVIPFGAQGQNSNWFCTGFRLTSYIYEAMLSTPRLARGSRNISRDWQPCIAPWTKQMAHARLAYPSAENRLSRSILLCVSTPSQAIKAST